MGDKEALQYAYNFIHRKYDELDLIRTQLKDNFKIDLSYHLISAMTELRYKLDQIRTQILDIDPDWGKVKPT